MKAHALICSSKEDFSLEPVTLPDPESHQVLIRTLWSGVSIGTEFAFIQEKIVRGGYPLCTGYMATGIVEYAGSDTAGYAEGDKVYFRLNTKMSTGDGTDVNLLNGSHASHAVCDPTGSTGVALLPEGVPEDIASAFVMPGVGLHGVDISNPRLGDVVLVFGAGLVGLSSMAWSNLRGCEVVACDVDEQRLEIARKIGALHCINSAKQDLTKELEKISPGGADVVIEATGIPQLLNEAIALVRLGGKFVWQGHYGTNPVSLDFLKPHSKRVQMFFPCDDGHEPARRATLRNIATGALRWEETITHRVSCEEAPGLYRKINAGGDHRVLGALIQWSDK